MTQQADQNTEWQFNWGCGLAALAVLVLCAFLALGGSTLFAAYNEYIAGQTTVGQDKVSNQPTDPAGKVPPEVPALPSTDPVTGTVQANCPENNSEAFDCWPGQPNRFVNTDGEPAGGVWQYFNLPKFTNEDSKIVVFWPVGAIDTVADFPDCSEVILYKDARIGTTGAYRTFTGVTAEMTDLRDFDQFWTGVLDNEPRSKCVGKYRTFVWGHPKDPTKVFELDNKSGDLIDVVFDGSVVK